MTIACSLVDYLREHELRLTTAESCTAGKIVTLLAEVPGSGSLIESGYVVYSPEAKQRLLGVNPCTIDTFNLTSREVAGELAAAQFLGISGMGHGDPLSALTRQRALMKVPQLHERMFGGPQLDLVASPEKSFQATEQRSLAG